MSYIDRAMDQLLVAAIMCVPFYMAYKIGVFLID